MEHLSLLKELGLKEPEVQIYAALLESGPTSIRKLATATSINRGTTYEALKGLSQAGLVAHVRKGERMQYRAEHPEIIYDLIADRRERLAQLDAAAQEFIPRLLATSHHARSAGPAVRFYEDDEGIVLILRDVLHTTAHLPRKTYYAYSSRQIRKYLYRRFPNFTSRRIAADVHVKVIAIGEGGAPDEKSERRWIPEPPASHFSSYTLIYGHKVALISVSPDETPYGVVIEDPGVASMQALMFDTLWPHLQ